MDQSSFLTAFYPKKSALLCVLQIYTMYETSLVGVNSPPTEPYVGSAEEQTFTHFFLPAVSVYMELVPFLSFRRAKINATYATGLPNSCDC